MVIDRVGPSASIVHDHVAVVCGGMGSQTNDDCNDRFFYPEYAPEQMAETTSERELLQE